MVLFIDIETYSGYDLKKVGVHKYTEHPDFCILTTAIATNNGGGPQNIDDDTLLKLLKTVPDYDTKIVAHNAEFERVCLNKFLQNNGVDIVLPTEKFIDTAAICAYRNIPTSLKEAAEFLRLSVGKMSVGTRLINKYCKPDKEGRQPVIDYDSEDWQLFEDYCAVDVAVLIELYNALNMEDLPNIERKLYDATNRMNEAGVLVDTELLEQMTEAYEKIMADGKAVADEYGVNTASPKQLLEFAELHGVTMPNTQAKTVESLYDTLEDGPLKTVLGVRISTSNASLKKLSVISNSLCEDGRVRDHTKYYGATATGRWSGKGIQLQNLIRSKYSYEDARAELDAGTADVDHLTSLIRSLFIAPEDKALVVIDYSQIEAVVAAWLTGDVDTYEAYHNGVDLHTRQAKLMYKTDDITKPMRQRAKTGNFACVYGGGPTAVYKAADDSLTEEESKETVALWRGSNKPIVDYWALCEERLGQAFELKGNVAEPLDKSEEAYINWGVQVSGSTLCITLPSNRRCFVNGIRKSSTGVVDGNGFSYFGGKMFNVLVQGIARDILAEAWLRIANAGHTVVMTVHDELVVEVESSVEYEEIHRLFTDMPWWFARGKIEGKIKADGHKGDRYEK